MSFFGFDLEVFELVKTENLEEEDLKDINIKRLYVLKTIEYIRQDILHVKEFITNKENENITKLIKLLSMLIDNLNIYHDILDNIIENKNNDDSYVSMTDNIITII